MAAITLNPTATLFAASAEATYASARAGGPNLYASEFGWIGQYFGGSYEVNQVFARFDLSGLPANALITGAKLILTVPESYGTHTVEAREAPAFTAGNAAAFIPGANLAARTLLGSTNFVSAFGITREIALTNFSRAGLANVVLHGAAQRTNTAPTGDTTTRVDSVKLELTYVVLVTTVGAGSFTVPAGVTSLTAECWSGGQGGSADRGGRGGNFSQAILTVTPGAVINFSVGAGGNGVQFASNVNGGDTWFSSTTACLAKGGGNTSGNVGNGPSFYGGAGGTGSQGLSGGGGGSAHPLGNGGNGSSFDGSTMASLRGGASGSTTATAGAAGSSNVEGGSGGSGGTSSSPYAGGAPGGGGGGGSSFGSGGAGGRGQIRLSWTASTTPPAPTSRAQRSFIWL